MKALCTQCSYRCDTRTLNDACPYCGERKKLTKIEDAEDLVEKL